jgi:hypothetical protein
MPSQTSQFIERVIRASLHPALKARGFTRQGHNWNRAVGDLRDVINLQGSFLNEKGSGSFTINLGKFSNAVDKIVTGAEPPRVVAELRCPVRIRLGKLIPALGETTSIDADPSKRFDRWWKFDPTTDPFGLSQELTETILTYGVPFFDQLDSLGAMLVWLSQTESKRPLAYPQNVHLGIIHDLLGDHNASALVLNELYDSYASKGYAAGEQLIIAVAERLQIELSGRN